MTVQLDSIVCAGGLDQITPTLALKNGFARQALNFEAAVTGGYTRIAGYERYDGHPSPSDSSLKDHTVFSASGMGVEPSQGTVLTFSGGGTGVVAFTSNFVFNVLSGTYTGVVTVTDLTKDIAPAEPFSWGFWSGEVVTVTPRAATSLEKAQEIKLYSDGYRSNITAVPGSGPVRGVAEHNGAVYAWRDNVGATALACYKSTSTGWQLVDDMSTISFTNGHATSAPVDGDSLTQGAVTDVIARVVLTSGSWQAGTAAGQLIIATPSGTYASGAATIGSATLDLSGDHAPQIFLPGGKLQIVESNFAGQAVTSRLYIADGINPAWEFDGTIAVKIYTGATVDTPGHVAAHRNYLFLAIGSSVMHSGPGLPYNFQAIGGANEIATGDDITDLVVMPGGTSQSTLGIFSRNNTGILYGTYPGDWNFIQYNTGTGAYPGSAQNMAQTLVFDDRGAASIQTALQYGNFDQSFLTNKLLPFVNSHINKLSTTTLCRRKSQYRLFFNNGDGLYITLVNGTLVGCMPVYFPVSFFCSYEGKTAAGEDVMLVGGTDGFVYQLDKGTSFDGDAIPFQLVLNYTSAKNPRLLKRYRRASIEISSDVDTQVAFDFTSILGYDSAEYSQPGSASYAEYLSSARWDACIWDSFFWDSNGLAPINCELDGSAENVALVVSGETDYTYPFNINSILIHYSPRRMLR